MKLEDFTTEGHRGSQRGSVPLPLELPANSAGPTITSPHPDPLPAGEGTLRCTALHEGFPLPQGEGHGEGMRRSSYSRSGSLDSALCDHSTRNSTALARSFHAFHTRVSSYLTQPVL